MAMAHFWYPKLLDCMTVPVLTLNFFRQPFSLQRYGIVLWLGADLHME